VVQYFKTCWTYKIIFYLKYLFCRSLTSDLRGGGTTRPPSNATANVHKSRRMKSVGHVEMRNRTKVGSERSQGKKSLCDLGVDETDILKLRKFCVAWLSIWPSSELLWTHEWTLGFHKRRECVPVVQIFKFLRCTMHVGLHFLVYYPYC
jgi:hypothetical protein